MADLNKENQRRPALAAAAMLDELPSRIIETFLTPNKETKAVLDALMRSNVLRYFPPLNHSLSVLAKPLRTTDRSAELLLGTFGSNFFGGEVA